MALALSACSLYRAHQDLGDIGDMANVVGMLEAPEHSARPLFIGLFRDENGSKSLAGYFVRYGTGPFRFIVPAGTYQLFAFEDANGNLRYDDGEASYYIGDRQAMSMQRLNELYAATGHIGFRQFKRTDGKLSLAVACNSLIMA